MKKRRFLKIFFLIFLPAIILLFYFYLYPSLRIATGYAAKYTCSYSFVSNLEYGRIHNSFNFFPVNSVKCRIDSTGKMVTATLWGLAERSAYFYKNGLACGCVLDSIGKLNSSFKENISRVDSGNLIQSKLFEPLNLADSQIFDLQKLNLILKETIDSNAATLAITMAYKNKLIAEKYANGVNTQTPLLGWSMTKTVLNALCGNMEKNGKLNLGDTSLLPEWNNDERKKITLNNLLQMSSGLKWIEEYSFKTDVTQMLYLEPNVAKYAIGKPLNKNPGDEWYYSSGTTNIISQILRNKFENYGQYLSFPFDSLFNIIGMNSATIEMDNSGNYIFSSYGWATARDWTKFGLLYLNKGNWFGKQIFDSGWADYSISPVKSSDQKYGAQIWLKASDKKIESVPDDAYFANGYGGQKILIIPSKEIVIVIMSGRQKDFDFNTFYSKIFGCIKE